MLPRGVGHPKFGKLTRQAKARSPYNGLNGKTFDRRPSTSQSFCTGKGLRTTKVWVFNKARWWNCTLLNFFSQGVSFCLLSHIHIMQASAIYEQPISANASYWNTALTVLSDGRPKFRLWRSTIVNENARLWIWMRLQWCNILMPS